MVNYSFQLVISVLFPVARVCFFLNWRMIEDLTVLVNTAHKASAMLVELLGNLDKWVGRCSWWSWLRPKRWNFWWQLSSGTVTKKNFYFGKSGRNVIVKPFIKLCSHDGTFLGGYKEEHSWHWQEATLMMQTELLKPASLFWEVIRNMNCSDLPFFTLCSREARAFS